MPSLPDGKCPACGKTDIASVSASSQISLESPACIIGKQLAEDYTNIRNEPFTSINGDFLIVTHESANKEPDEEISITDLLKGELTVEEARNQLLEIDTREDEEDESSQ